MNPLFIPCFVLLENSDRKLEDSGFGVICDKSPPASPRWERCAILRDGLRRPAENLRLESLASQGMSL